MVGQIQRRLSYEQVKMILDRYVKKELGAEQAMNLLGLKRSQFFELVRSTGKLLMVLSLSIAVGGVTGRLAKMLKKHS